ncbi:CGNR zinc finger domain-containing protein [Nocardia arthritidis]|uniref:CGNR zinc finger domain-containing protein n=1 Tax=Nocardia arthritidis TaxID=228602 RepID=A0A6G9Y8S4_9NOCA|nr:CGNR zinc finger domain-containing protein [Nocardia arthritidis]QIS09520.1 CGNR zinc finger domain-containing protein [Nocardia arthritidis]
MHFNPYGGAAAELAVRLVNANPKDPIWQVLSDANYKPLGPLDARQVDRLRRWILELAEVFREPTVDRINALLRKTTSRPYISTHDGRAPHLHFAPADAPVDERVRAYTAVGLATVFCEDPGRIGTCAREGCTQVFVDVSRNGRRRFCSTRCSTRVHVAEYRRRAG